VVKHWHRFPREVVDASFMETFMLKLDGALSNQIQLKVSLLTAEGCTRWPLKVLSNPNYSMIKFFQFPFKSP